jgi:hypothetical protein
MRALLASAALIPGACLYSVGSTAADDAETITALRAMALELDQAYADEDMATIEQMLEPDHRSIAARYGGAAALTEQVGTFDRLERRNFDYSPVEVEFLTPDIALVSFEKSTEGSFEGQPLPSRVAVSEIWRRHGDRWLQRLYQETVIAPP